ncbi:craniofacial development protein 2-like [Magallana gigas]|uniref:craniofacial development protein 2-like n=1 Tax=Magallana gigas TaxID=29159 RepID=UPI003342CA86
MTCAGESHQRVSAPTNLLSIKANTRIGTWNIRTLYEVGKAAQVAKEMTRYNIKVLGLSEVRWNERGQVRLESGETIIYSGHEDQDHAHTQGVALMLSPEATKEKIAWEPVSPRLMSDRFNSKGRKITIIQCYAPINASEEQEKDEFYAALQSMIDHMDHAPRRDIKVVMGDLNAKVGEDNTNKELIMGKHSIGNINENGELFTDFCNFNDLVIGGTIFPHKRIHKTTWSSPDGKTENQIDHITIMRKWRSLLDVRTRRGADAASDHQLVTARLRMKLRAFKDKSKTLHYKFNVHLLKIKEKSDEFNIAISNKFDALEGLTVTTIEDHLVKLQDTWKTACSEVLGKRKREHKDWMTAETWEIVKIRKELKQKINQCKDAQQKKGLKKEYRKANKQVKKNARKDRRQFVHDMTEETETSARQNNMKRLYEISRTLSGKNVNTNTPVRDKQGKIISSDIGQRARWVEHFKENTVPDYYASAKLKRVQKCHLGTGIIIRHSVGSSKSVTTTQYCKHTNNKE